MLFRNCKNMNLFPGKLIAIPKMKKILLMKKIKSPLFSKDISLTKIKSTPPIKKMLLSLKKNGKNLIDLILIFIINTHPILASLTMKKNFRNKSKFL
jgi:hypothetical protein